MKKKNPIQIKFKDPTLETIEYYGSSIVSGAAALQASLLSEASNATHTVWGGSWFDDSLEIDLNDDLNFDLENPFDRRLNYGFRICRTTKR